MQQPQRALEHVYQSWLGPFRVQFDHFQIPVTELMPEKKVHMPRAFMKVVLLDGPIDVFGGTNEARKNPAIDQ